MKEHRKKILKIRVTNAEHLALRERSTKPKLAQWLRELGLGQDVKPEVPPVDPELTRHLGMIGNNLNQIARKLNSFKPVAQAEILTALKKLSSEIERLGQ